MDCKEAGELVDAYALGALERDDVRSLEQHLSTCTACHSLYCERADVAGQLALVAPLRQASPTLRLRLLSRVGAPEGKRRIPIPYTWAAAAALLLAISLGALGWDIILQDRVSDLQADNSRLIGLVEQGTRAQASLVATQEALFSQEGEMEAALQEQDMMLAVALDDEAHLYDMLGTGRAAEAYVRYVWSAQYNLGILYAANLPAPPSGTVYQLWLLTEERAVSGGTFAPGDDGRARLLVRDPSVTGPVVAIEVSLEPEGGSDVPSGTTVLHGKPPTPQ